MSYLQPVDEMERISRSELGERLDELLERATDENIGFVITDQGKNDLVLCPASWFDICYDGDFGCILNCAVRYAIGRRTYMPSVVAGFVSKYLGKLDSRTVGVMIEDIERELSAEDLSDRDLWQKLRDDLLARQEQLRSAKQDKAEGRERE